MLPASRGVWPGMLSILQCMGRPSPQRMIRSKVPLVLRLSITHTTPGIGASPPPPPHPHISNAIGVMLPSKEVGLVNGRDFVLLRGLCKLGARAKVFRSIKEHVSTS